MAPGQFKGLEPIWRNKWIWVLMGWVSLPQRWLLNFPKVQHESRGWRNSLPHLFPLLLPSIFQTLFMLAIVSFAGWELSNSLSCLSVCRVTFYTLLYFTRRSGQCRHLEVISQYFHLTVSKFQILHLGLWPVMNYISMQCRVGDMKLLFCKKKII